MQLWLVRMNENSNDYVICSAHGREIAKHMAFKWFGAGDFKEPREGNPDNYIVTPLTMPGDRVHLDITVSA